MTGEQPTIYISDMEANGLRPDKIWCIVLKEYRKDVWRVYIPDKEYFKLADKTNYYPLSKFKDLDFSKIRLVFHNASGYDIPNIKRLLGVTIPDYRDTLVMSRLDQIYRENGHSIEAWSNYLGLSEKKKILGDEAWSEYSTTLVERCKSDVIIGEAVYRHLSNSLRKDTTVQSLLIEQEAALYIEQQVRQGVKLDIPYVHKLYVECKGQADILEEEIQKTFKPRSKPTEPVELKVKKDGQPSLRKKGFTIDEVWGTFSPLEIEAFNCNSPTQRVQRLLEIGWKPIEYTEKGFPKLTEESLANLPEDAPPGLRQFSDYLMYRSKEKTFEQWLDLADKDGMVHGRCMLLTARTMRATHNNPNLANIARTEVDKQKQVVKGKAGRYGWESRSCFTVVSDRNCLIGCDAAGIQLRALAHYAENPEYIQLVSEPGKDIHQDHADTLSVARPTAKTWIYSFLMGAGPPKLGSIVLPDGNVNVWRKRGNEDLEKFYGKYPFIKKFKEDLARWSRRGYMYTLHGARLEIPSEHLAMSTALQSFEANIMNYAMVLYHNELYGLQIPFWQRLFVHDEFLVETEEERGDEVGHIIGKNIVKSGELLGSRCPMAYEMKKGKTWSDCH